tara:strand:- start:3363 stop:4244 length:882 start_codon:yes stop_codon:yes gene_type:complete
MPEFEESKGFKLRSGNKSPFKMMGSSTPAKFTPPNETPWEKGSKIAKRYDQDLNQLTKDRKKHKKGSDEYNKIQNQINYYLRSDKEHGRTYDAKTTKGDLTRVKTVYGSRHEGKGKMEEKTHIPGIETVESKTKVGKRKTKSKHIITSHLGSKSGETDTQTRKEGKGGRSKYKSVQRDASGKKVYVYKSKDPKNKPDKPGETDYRGTDVYKDLKRKTKLKMKYDKAGNIIKSKEIDRSTKGRRKVEKYNPKTDKVTTTTRRTLKGLLTGKGKGKKTKKVEKHDYDKHEAGSEI